MSAMNENTSLAEVERRLRDFFQDEMPHPWPAAPRTESAPAARRGSGLRLALAASVALVLAGYLALAGFFPRTVPTQALDVQGPHIADRPTHHSAQPAPG